MSYCFGQYDILNNILPIHELGKSFHLRVSSSVSFINGLQFSMYRSLAPSAKFITRYFILFDATVSGIIFKIHLSHSFLIV